MGISQLQIPTYGPSLDITPQLSQLAATIDAGQKQQKLSDLGKGLADGTIDYRQAAAQAADLGSTDGLFKFLQLAEAKDKLTKGQASSNQLYTNLGSLLGGGTSQAGAPTRSSASAAPVAAGATVPNDSNALPGQVGMNLKLADRTQDFLQDYPNTTMSSGVRSAADQARLYADRANNSNPVAVPGTSNHERGMAVDIAGMTPEQRGMLPQYGLSQPVAGDPVHVELARQPVRPGNVQIASTDPSALPANTQPTQGAAASGQPTQGAAPSAANGFQGLNASHIPMLLKARADPYLPKEDQEFADKLITKALDNSKPTDKISTLQTLKQESGYQGTILDLEKDLRAASKPQVTVDQRGETEEAKAAGKAAGERRASMFASAGAASKTLQNLSRTEALLNQVSQGKLEPGRMNISAWAKAFGMNDDVATSIGLDPKGVGSAQALQSLVNESVIGKIGPGGFPANNFSDADREFITGIFPRLGDDPQANKIRIEGARRMANLDMQRARDYQAWKANPDNKNKGFEDFETQWSDKISKQDIFGDLRKQAEAIAGPPRIDIGGTLNNPGRAPGATGQWGGTNSAQPGRKVTPNGIGWSLN